MVNASCSKARQNAVPSSFRNFQTTRRRRLEENQRRIRRQLSRENMLNDLVVGLINIASFCSATTLWLPDANGLATERKGQADVFDEARDQGVSWRIPCRWRELTDYAAVLLLEFVENLSS